MRIISAPLAAGVIGSGIYYPIKTDFKVWLNFAAAIEQGGDARDYMRAVRMCYEGKIPPDPAEAFTLLCDFFAGGGKKHAPRSGERIFSFAADEELIFASFMSQYGINLFEAHMHWWHFLALLRALAPETPLMRAAHVRSVKLSDIKDSALRRRISEQKRIWALDDEKTAEVADVIAAAFSAGAGGDMNG